MTVGEGGVGSVEEEEGTHVPSCLRGCLVEGRKLPKVYHIDVSTVLWGGGGEGGEGGRRGEGKGRIEWLKVHLHIHAYTNK